jgi:hypothetical protein
VQIGFEQYEINQREEQCHLVQKSGVPYFVKCLRYVEECCRTILLIFKDLIYPLHNISRVNHFLDHAAVERLAEVLCYEPEGYGFDSQRGH